MGVQEDLLIGVDFSGAQRAGRKIWIAEARGRKKGVCLLSVETAAQKLGLPSGERERIYPALCHYLMHRMPRAVGLDFPFGLPAPLTHAPNLIDFILRFPRRFPDLRNFEPLRRQASRRGEPKRQTDMEGKAPFSPLNLRLYRQTYFGIKEVLAPLLQTGRFGIPPVQPLDNQRTGLLEVCPASLLKKLGLYRPYKGHSPAQRRHRETILHYFLRQERLDLAHASLYETLVNDQGGDALDSFLALWIAFTAVRRSDWTRRPLNPLTRKEGFIFF